MDIKEYYRESGGYWGSRKYTLHEMFELYCDNKEFRTFINKKQNGISKET
jgi:hypothetical protein